jgi:hypothetical protein
MLGFTDNGLVPGLDVLPSHHSLTLLADSPCAISII